MKDNELLYIEVLPKNTEDVLFTQRESGVTHTPYETETIFYSYLRAGDVEGVKNTFKELMRGGVVIGRMSMDDLRQMQYWAVCCITLGTRYAIQGGLAEAEAYNLSDTYIRHVDKLETPSLVLQYVTERAVELTELVKANKARASYPPVVKKCMAYVGKNLHGKLTVAALADEFGISADYLSSLFKKYTGLTLSAYITDKKLEAAKAMLNGKYRYGDIGYYLGFSSESHFINRFKKKYGVTPKQYAAALEF